MMRKRRTKKEKRLTVVKGILIIGTLSAAAVLGYLYKEQKGAISVISQGVYIENISLGGKKLSEAEALIQEKYGSPLISKKIQIEASNKTYVLDFSKLEARYDIDKVTAEAFSYGKEGNILEKLINKKSGERKDFHLSFTYNSKPIDELIDKIEKEINKNAVDAKISITNGQVKITPEVEGVKLQKDKLREAIVAQFNGEKSKDTVIIKAPLEVAKPKIISEKLSVVNTLISSFSTNFSTSIANRINNIELATKAINGTILMPGETFSFNEIVGERTKERGYKEAGVIIGDKVESGLGGGICQVSSTLYNAMLTANLKAEERRNHTLPLGYVGKGLDATVDWGNIDFQFKNTLNTPIFIEGYTKNKNVYFNIYSDKELTKRTYKMVADIYDTVQPTVKYIDNPNLNEGMTQVIKNGSAGYKVKVYRNTFENGKLINTELISNDYYKAIDGEISRGLKKVVLN
jgi:vancomycin resistance protein YoaR